MFLRIVFYFFGLPILFSVINCLVVKLLAIPVKKFVQNRASQIKYLGFFGLWISATISLYLITWIGETYLHPPSFVLLTVPSIMICHLKYLDMKKLYYFICFDESWIPDTSVSSERNALLRQQSANSIGAWYIYGFVLGFGMPVAFLYKCLPFW